MPMEEIHTPDKDTFLARLRSSLGGFAAEKLKYGVTSSGVGSDFSAAAWTAHHMVWGMGMGRNGFIGDYSSIPKDERSARIVDGLEQESQDLLREQLAETEKLLKDNWQIVERFTKELLAREELDYDEIAAIFIEYGHPPRLLPGITEPPGGGAPAK
ncbi:MAG: hypothetical protein A3J79_13645 [Elusimicrobia bacterium RIFOXYB2_FULL_62_6]|nr:MAG: hypothetical protein A3J79_13645 [Elusimicrobia bacterium RIFOXYB2_FULL_62_6]